MRFSKILFFKSKKKRHIKRKEKKKKKPLQIYFLSISPVHHRVTIKSIFNIKEFAPMANLQNLLREFRPFSSKYCLKTKNNAFLEDTHKKKNNFGKGIWKSDATTVIQF